ncbi:hypothetical protein OAV62_01590 [bacterium]|nr:hypothetical protein [bacterium]
MTSALVNQFTVVMGRYHCGCGSSLKRSSLRMHLKTRKHKKFLTGAKSNVLKECTICCEDKNVFWKCTTCINDHCTDCHDAITNFKCPYCRTSWTRPVPELEPSEDGVNPAEGVRAFPRQEMQFFEPSEDGWVNPAEGMWVRAFPRQARPVPELVPILVPMCVVMCFWLISIYR